MSAQGKLVESSRGYVIFAWSGPAVDAGTKQRFSVTARHYWGGSSHDTLEEARAALAAMPALVEAEVSFSVYVPADATEEQVEEWVEFALGANGSLSGSNPCSDLELSAHDVYINSLREVR